MSRYTEGQLRLKLEALQIQHDRLRSRVPVRIGDVQTPKAIVIIGGQSFGTFNSIESFGIMKYTPGTLSGIPNGTYDPGTVNSTTGVETGAPTPGKSAWPVGLGYGTLWTGFSYLRVIVCNDQRGIAAASLIGGADDDTTYAPSWRTETILSQRTLTVSKVDLSLVYAYSPDLA